MTNLLIEILFWVILLTYLGNRFTKIYKAINKKVPFGTLSELDVNLSLKRLL